MKLDLKRINAAITPFSFLEWPRIIPLAHRHTPCGAGYGSSRFSSPNRTFKVLYAAVDFPTAFAEAVIRDLYVGKTRRYIGARRLANLAITALDSTESLNILDLTGGEPYLLGIDTDAKGSRSHTVGQQLAQLLHDGTDADAIKFPSRLSGQDCIAVFERAFGKVSAVPAIDLVRSSHLTPEINRLEIIVRR